MNRYEAIQALFGDDPTKACQEAVDVLMDAMVLDDADLENLPGQVTDAFDVFCEDKQKAVRQLKEDDPRLPFYKQLAGEIEEAEDEDEAPADEPLNKPPVTGLKGILDFVSKQPDGHEEIGSVDDLEDEEDEEVEEEEKEEKPKPKPKKLERTDGEKDASKQPEQPPKPVLVYSVPTLVQNLLRTPAWTVSRKKIEDLHQQTTSPDPTIRIPALSDMFEMAVYMRAYANGDCGIHKITHGRHALECIVKLEEGIDQNSEWYLTRFVDGKERKRNNPDSSDS